MKIALIGWSGNDNWGDERMHYCIKKFFHNHKIVRFTSFLDAILNIKKINSCDFVLLGGGGLIFRGFNRYSEFLSSITKPIGCIGISIESEALDVDMREGLEILKEKALFIYVRDQRSKAILDSHFKVIVGPDISFLYPYKPTPEVKNEVCAVNFRNWYWWDFELHSAMHERLARWDSKYSWIRLIYPFKKWSPDKCMRYIKYSFNKLKPFPLYFGKYDQTDTSILKKYFRKVPNRTELSTLKNSRYLIGMRLHSLIFATQLGVPFISLSYEPKNVNFCLSLLHPELSLPLLKYSDIRKKIAFIKENHEVLRHDLLDYTRKSQAEAEYIFTSILSLMEKIALSKTV